MSKRGFAAIGLDNPKDEKNIGSALRAAKCYDASLLVVSGDRYSGICTDTTKAYKHMPMLQVNDILDAIPYRAVPVAIDIIEGAKSLVDFEHPESAFYIFGAEDRTLDKRITDRCKHVVYVPTSQCMNLAATVNVVLYDRKFKQLKGE